MIKKYEITYIQYESILKLENWKFYDVPQECWNNFKGVERLNDTFAIIGSADVNDPKIIHELSNIISGFDVLTLETNPKPQEPEGNAYHYIIQKIEDPYHQFFLYGPYFEGMATNHWFTSKDLEAYN
jgi:hypothetical protein